MQALAGLVCVFGHHAYLYGLHAIVAKFLKREVYLRYVCKGLVLAYQPYLVVLLYAGGAGLRVLVALAEVGGAALGYVRRLYIGPDGKPPARGLIYAGLYVVCLGRRLDLGLYRRRRARAVRP